MLEVIEQAKARGLNIALNALSGSLYLVQRCQGDNKLSLQNRQIWILRKARL